jgi:hypothetical protein
MSQTALDTTAYILSAIEIEIAVYILHKNDSDETAKSLFHTTAIPHASVDRPWKSPVYQGCTGKHLLPMLTTASRDWRDCVMGTAWYNTVLLFGRFGSGKTSLAHALTLAQRLSIRLSDIYTSTKILQADAVLLSLRCTEGLQRRSAPWFQRYIVLPRQMKTSLS